MPRSSGRARKAWRWVPELGHTHLHDAPIPAHLPFLLQSSGLDQNVTLEVRPFLAILATVQHLLHALHHSHTQHPLLHMPPLLGACQLLSTSHPSPCVFCTSLVPGSKTMPGTYLVLNYECSLWNAGP